MASLLLLQIVLEEVFDANYIPTKAEIQEYADWLGLDMKQEEVRAGVRGNSKSQETYIRRAWEI